MHIHHCKILTMFFTSSIVLINYYGIFGSAEFTDVVKTVSGPLRGEILITDESIKYAAFKGIRYARAPIRNLRFQPPRAVASWTKVRNAISEGPDCPQIDTFLRGFRGSEDCLFLNVMTPVTNFTKISGKLKPVMVWIHGGGFKSGTSSTRLYRPDYIMKKDVVYVAFNYRLGPFGFLSLNHPNATGNAGLKDQVFAIKWIRANIMKFGGNPNNVTLFGQSAGGVSVGLHVLSEASKGLFHGAIGMSGQALGLMVFKTPAESQMDAEKLGATLGATSNRKNHLLKILYRASAVDIINAADLSPSLGWTFGPTIEDETIATDVFMTQCPVVKYTTGNFTKIPQILGFTNQEAIWFFSFLAPMIKLIRDALDSFEVFRSEWPEKLVRARNIVDSWTGGDIEKDKLQILVDVASDVVFKSTIDQAQRILAVNNDDKPIFYYRFSYFAKISLHNILMNVTLEGAGHSDDLAFLFYFPEANYSTNPADPSRRTINRITTMWTNFAKYGNPTPNWIRDDSLGVSWPNSGLPGTTLDIGKKLTVRPRLIDDVARFVQLITWPLIGKQSGCHA